MSAKALNRRARAYKGLRDYHSARRDCVALLALAEETPEGGERLAKDAKAILAGVDKAEASERKAER